MKPSALALIFLLLGSGQPSSLLAKNKTTPTKTTKSKAPAPAKKTSKPTIEKATLPVAPYSLSGKAAEGVAAYLKDDYSKAASLLAEHRKSYPDDTLAHTLGFLEARALILAKKRPEAKTRLEALSAKEGPLQSEVFYLLGDLYEDDGDKKKAQEALSKVERGSRRYDSARLMLAGLSSSL
jgi:TolA-binding protein